MRKFIGILCALAAFGAVKAETFIVNSVDDLQYLATQINSGQVSQDGLVIQLDADLDMTGVNWIPIGTPEIQSPSVDRSFNGIFDGQGHTISNLNVNCYYGTTDGVAGLFGKIGPNGVVKDVHIRGGMIALLSTDPNDETGNTTTPLYNACYLGAIAGINEGTVTGCSNTATVSGTSWTEARIGGIVGKNDSGARVQDCYNLGDTFTSFFTLKFIGGVVGNNKGYIENCFMRSKVIRYDKEHGLLSEEVYPLFANDDNADNGSITGCFYANGESTHRTLPISIANNEDNSSTINDNQGEGKNVMLSGRTLYTDGYWSTICLPFSIPGRQEAGYSPIAGATVMELVSSTFSETTKNLTMVFKNATSIEAGKPYIVRWDKAIAGNIQNPVFLNATVSTTLTSTETQWVNFIGFTSQVSIAEEDRTLLYLGANNKLVYPSGAMTFGACRAYFQLIGLEVKSSDPSSDPTETGINIVMDFDGTETAIQTVESDIRDRKDGTAQVWYSLDGRRLVGKPSAKGVYIHSGRKVVIR